MPRPVLTAEQRRETRRSIRRAAAKLYASKGLQNITARAIAQAAGVSVGTLYSYFDNLTELMQSLWKEPVSRLLAELETLATQTPEPDLRLRSLLERYVRFAIDENAVYRGAFLFVRSQSAASPEKVKLDDDRFFNLLKSAVIDGQAQGLFRSGDPASLTQTLWAAVHGAIALPTNIDRLRLDVPEQQASRMIDAMLEWLSCT